MPVAQSLRRTPFHVRKDVEKKLKELQDLDIIEDVDGPTPWVSLLVAVPKSNGDIRVCVDMRRVNEVILRERHPIPTLEETLQDLNGLGPPFFQNWIYAGGIIRLNCIQILEF
jgi:hypothetical protein